MSITEFLPVWGFSLAGFLLLWPLSLWRRDSSMVDFWWGPGFGVMALAVWIGQGRPTDPATLAILLPLLIWSARLGLHLGWRRIDEGEEDPRYRDLRTKNSPGWWWKSLFMVFILQSVLQGLIAWPILAALGAAADVQASGLLIMLGLLALVAVGVETVADIQLDRFKKRSGPHGLLTTGLRGIVRHPNYSAEIAFWVLMSLMAVLVGVGWGVLSALIVTGLLCHVSGVTVIDARMRRTRPDYTAYAERLPALVPRLSALRQGASDRSNA